MNAALRNAGFGRPEGVRLGRSSRGLDRSRRNSGGGFSILELLVALGLVSVVSLVAVPEASQLFRQYQFAVAVNQLAADLSIARLQAVAQSRFVRVRFLGSSSYVIERSSDGVSFTQYGATIPLPSRIGGSGTGPTFDRSGLPNQAVTMSLTDGRVVRLVRVNIVGGVSTG